MNEKIYELKRKPKGVNEAIFVGNRYEAILTIEGLSGSEKEWIASLHVNNKRSYSEKIYKTQSIFNLYRIIKIIVTLS